MLVFPLLAVCVCLILEYDVKEQINTTGERGMVKAVGMRSTRLLTRDDILITIPNPVITNVKIVNQSAPYPHYRVRFKIEVAYGSDLEQVERILVNVAQGNPLVMEDPAPRARL
jgi:MscS family membrane protein